jgi:hypothetical protein
VLCRYFQIIDGITSQSVYTLCTGQSTDGTLLIASYNPSNFTESLLKMNPNAIPPTKVLDYLTFLANDQMKYLYLSLDFYNQEMVIGSTDFAKSLGWKIISCTWIQSAYIDHLPIYVTPLSFSYEINRDPDYIRSQFLNSVSVNRARFRVF